METNYFDPGKSIEGLAQFDQAAANSALTFSANFIAQIDNLAVSLQTMADTAAVALTTAFSTGATAMGESVGTTILDITAKIQEMQVIGSEALAIFSESAIVTFAAINENFLVQADVLNLKFAETALAIETNLLVALTNIELAFVTAFSNIQNGLFHIGTEMPKGEVRQSRTVALATSGQKYSSISLFTYHVSLSMKGGDEKRCCA